MTGSRSPWMDDDLDALRDLARAFCEKEIQPHLDRFIDQHQVDRDLWRAAGELGLLGLSIPEEYGGGGRIGDTAWGAAMHNAIVAHYLLAYGTEEQKRTWLPRLCSGEVVGALAMTEPGTGSDLQAIRTRAVREGDDYVINGAKTFITNGGQADLVIVVAKTGAIAGWTRSASGARTPRNCSSTTCACRWATCSASPRARASSS
ncbi:Probable acyl CoA dehydrogenase [Mycobacteroides abscessus subsp. abscessus]|nr:Probable acyl CoA dehydrogenase [Mycobacteroides abscessus subsp. abscessus]